MKTVAERTASHRPNLLLAALGSAWPVAVGIVIALILQIAIAPAIGDFWAKMVLDIGIAIVVAVSLNIVNGFAGQFSIGHAGFMMVGAYAAAWMTYYGSIKLWGSPAVHGDFLGGGDLLFLGSCLLAGLVAAGAGVVVGLPSLRLRGDYLAIVTLGFGEIVRVLAQVTKDVQDPGQVKDQSMLSLVDNLGGALGFSGAPAYTRIFYVYVFVALTLIAAYRLKSSSQGRALLAVRENEVAAEAVGIRTTRAKVSAFVMAAFFAGIGGALFVHQVSTSLNPRELGFQKSIDIVIMVVLGGMGSISGVALAAVLLTILPELFREFAQYRMIVYALALILMMIVRPKGLLGIRELWEITWREWREMPGHLLHLLRLRREMLFRILRHMWRAARGADKEQP